MSEPMISVSGVRGIVNDSFSELLVRTWARAFGLFCLERKKNTTDASVVVGRDTRQSGVWAEKFIAEELCKLGVQPILAGIVPTPTVELAVTHHRATGGIIITASHNPVEWNGLKFLGADGVFLDNAEVEHLKLLADAVTPDTGIDRNINTSDKQDDEAIKRHVEKVLVTLPLNLDKIRAKKFRVVLDPVNGAGALAVPLLLERLGCETTIINGEPSGIFNHTPEPRPENLTDLTAKVKETGATIGFAVDPDADRLALINEQGEAISEEYTLAIAAMAALRELRIMNDEIRITIVVNLSTSRMIDDVAKMFDAKVVRTAVGEINVVKGMRDNNAFIGGEGNGGVIFPGCHEGRDSLVGIALLLNLMADTNQTLSELTGQLPQYTMAKEKFPRPVNFDLAALQSNLLAIFPNAAFSSLDGLRMDTTEGWTHIRNSNTEPIVRIITEAVSEEAFNKLSEAARVALKKLN